MKFTKSPERPSQVWGPSMAGSEAMLLLTNSMIQNIVVPLRGTMRQNRSIRVAIKQAIRGEVYSAVNKQNDTS